MEIELNGEKLEFTLEKEKNLNEVIEAMESWLSESNMVITSLHTGEKDLYCEPREHWAGIPLAHVQKLAITAQSIPEIQLNSIRTVKEFLSLLKKAILAEDRQTLEQLKSGYSYMLESIYQLLSNEPASDTTTKSILDFFQKNGIAILDSRDETTQSQFFSQLDALQSKLDVLLDRESDPIEALNKIQAALKPTVAEIRDVSLQLQTGKDRNAMDTIIRFSDNMQELLSVLQIIKTRPDFNFSNEIIAGQSVEIFYNEFNTILNQLIDAFDIKDYVLIGDLLEYEIAPRLEGVIDFIEKFVKSCSMEEV